MSFQNNIFDAVAHGTVEDVRHLLEEKGADVNIKDENDYTPLHVAAQKGKLEIAKELLSHKANANARDIENLTPLHIAVGNRNVEVAKVLISARSDVNAQDKNGMTPLHWAAHEGELEAAKFLVFARADVNAETKKGNSPRTLAEKKGHADVARYLKSVGGKTSGSSGSSSGCYIATAVYNSYDAPEVLCLRRFRDEVISTYIFGRLFIKLYYRFSPYYAEKLKKTRHINVAVRKALDKIVGRINNYFGDTIPQCSKTEAHSNIKGM